MNLLNNFKQYIKQHHLFTAKDKLLLAVSGGVDSVVLCELCHQAKFDFAIAHCNFQLRGAESDRDEKFVRDLAAKYKVEIFVQQFDTNAAAATNKTSIEETARNLRYQWFEEIRCSTLENSNVVHRTSYILTAHHANDNIETVLMNFFRGTGVKGLRGILPKVNKIIRPLLFAKRSEIEQYAVENNLTFVTDSTNAQNDYTRNYFRNELIPSIQKIFPQTQENILHNIDRMTEVEELYNQAVDLHKLKLCEVKGNEIHIPVLKLAKAKPLPTIIYEIVKEFGFTALQTNDIISLLNAESGKYIQSTTHRIIRNRKWLIISPKNTNEAVNILIEETDKKVCFENGELQFKINSIFNIQHSIFNVQLDASKITFPLLLRKWKQGDYFYPLGMMHKKKLSRFFIDNKLSIAQKENVWVIESNKKILWVIGMRIDNRFKVTENTKQILEISFSQIKSEDS
ncbi:MAG: tRNA lysidine(34) synthetase TilS [Ferruginibacter sp.]|nr:tRNA lysidine(34) synthetase TilS [Ferruginibacter sp.]